MRGFLRRPATPPVVERWTKVVPLDDEHGMETTVVLVGTGPHTVPQATIERLLVEAGYARAED